MEVLIWKCHKCKDVIVSKARQHHSMDLCKCKQAGVDLEEYYRRVMGSIKILKRLDDEVYAPNLELSLCWLNQFGGEMKDYHFDVLIKLVDEIWKQL